MGKRKEKTLEHAGRPLRVDPMVDVTKEPEGISTAERTLWRMARVKVVMLEVKRDPDRPLTSAGKPAAAKTVAQGIVARQLGITPMGLRQSFIRFQRAQASEADSLERYPVDTLGVLADHQAMKDVHELIELVDIAEGHMGSALSTVRQMHARHLPCAHDVLEPMYEDLKTMKDRLVQRLRPVSVCPYCKCLEGHSESCEECSSTGLANREALNAAPYELRDDFKVVVHTHGVTKPVDAKLLKKPDREDERSLDDIWS